MSQSASLSEETGPTAREQSLERLRRLGLIVREVDADAAPLLLAELDNFDESEQRETFAYLRRALNETRAAQGARLIFPNEQVEEVEVQAEDLPLDRPRKSGVVIRPGNREGAMALLDQLLAEGDPEEERETLAFLKQAINEHRAAVGARLTFTGGETMSSPTVEETEMRVADLPIDRPRPSGIELRPGNVAAALKLLDSFYEEDPEEQRETLAYLMRALDEGRAARGERRLFVEEDE